MKNGLIAATNYLVDHVAHALEHHPKFLTAVAAALMLGGGGGALAVASSMAPDPALWPVRQILEDVEPLPVQVQAEALDAHSLRLFRSETTRANDTVESLLARLGISDMNAAAYLRNDATFRTQVLGRAGRNLTAEVSARQGLDKLSVRWVPEDNGQFKRLVVERTPQREFVSRVETAPLTASSRLASGAIRTSLFAAVDDARIPDDVAMQVADIFSNDIDFHRGLRRGDRFSVVYEALEADGEPMRTGRVLSVEFMNNGRLHQAVWFQEPGKKGAYYTMDGKSLASSYLGSPMEFSRVTSGFAVRFHPILKMWKAHLGVDYGAPTGTPVRTVGDGIVEFAGVQNGFGNVVFVRHNKGDVTVYAHLSRIDVRAGQAVTQAQRIGAVGSTGWATGPHLHFEFRVNGHHEDPLVMARRSEGAVLSAAVRPAFDLVAGAMRLQLSAAAASSLQASAQ